MGSLSPWQQAMAVAMIEVSKMWHLTISYAQIATRLVKVGGGHPSKQAVAQLHATDSDTTLVID